MPQISTHQRCCLDTRRPLEFWAMVCLNLSVLDFGGHRESIRGAHPPPEKNITIKKFSRNFANWEILQFPNLAIRQFGNYATLQYHNFGISQFHNFENLRNAMCSVYFQCVQYSSNVHSIVPMCTDKFQCVQYSFNVYSILSMCTV